MQARRDREGRKGVPASHPSPALRCPPPHLRLRVAPPNALPLPRGTPSIRPLFRSFRSHRPGDPCPALPHGSCQLLGAALPFSPGQLRCPRVPDLPRIASTCAPDAPSRGPLAPSSPGPKDLYSLQSPSRTLRRSGCPSHACPGVPRSSPESARSSPARPPRFPRPPRAGSAPWAGGWAPASWSWPSGPCRRAEPSQGHSAAPGSPQRRPPRPTRWDPALTGRLPPPIGWGRCYSPEAPPHPEASPPAPAPSGAPQRAPPRWALGTARRAVTGPDACQSPGPTASGGGGAKGGAGAALTCPRPPLPRERRASPRRALPAPGVVGGGHAGGSAGPPAGNPCRLGIACLRGPHPDGGARDGPARQPQPQEALPPGPAPSGRVSVPHPAPSASSCVLTLPCSPAHPL